MTPAWLVARRKIRAVEAEFAAQPSMESIVIDGEFYVRDDLVTPGQRPFGHPELRLDSEVAAFFAWARFIIGLTFVPSVRKGTRLALSQWTESRERLADAPGIDPAWLAAREIDRRRSSDV